MGKYNFSVIIPSYNPDEKLLTVVEGLERLGVDDIIVVNDGSKSETLCHFDFVKSHPSVTLLVHEVNKGKGAALKTAFRYILKTRPNTIGCVTADGDAQHLPEDIIACGVLLENKQNGITLGVRDFSLPHVPSRSKKGNKITSSVFMIFVGMKLSDTQTGLRAIPFEYLEEMCNISGDRYEYETNMLLAMKKLHIPYTEKIIETVYIEENKTSHFNPIRDSWRIYKLILAHFFFYTLSSLGCLLLEQLLQTTIFVYTNGKFIDLLVELFSFLPARIISSVVNFFVNRKFVFSANGSCTKELIRYYILWFCQTIATMLLDLLFGFIIFGAASSVLYTIVTLCVKGVIAIVSYRIQKDWVFDTSKEDKK